MRCSAGCNFRGLVSSGCGGQPGSAYFDRQGHCGGRHRAQTHAASAFEIIHGKYAGKHRGVPWVQVANDASYTQRMSAALLELAHTITDHDGIHVPFFRIEGKDVTVHDLLATARASVGVGVCQNRQTGLIATHGNPAIFAKHTASGDRLQHSHVSGRDVHTAFQQLEDQENNKFTILVYACLHLSVVLQVVRQYERSAAQPYP